jgi:hypothetical protein
LAASALALFCLALGACGHEIGDGCKTAADCDPNGTRACDLSQPGGYCTQIGCDDKSCPSGSVCLRIFPESQLYETKRGCVPACEDLPPVCQDGGAIDSCAPDGGTGMGPCPKGATDDCTADELCLDSGVCVKRSYETRQCAKACGGNDDCRGGYQCRPAAETGMMLLATNPATTSKVCAPKLPQTPTP